MSSSANAAPPPSSPIIAADFDPKHLGPLRKTGNPAMTIVERYGRLGAWKAVAVLKKKGDPLSEKVDRVRLAQVAQAQAIEAGSAQGKITLAGQTALSDVSGEDQIAHELTRFLLLDPLPHVTASRLALSRFHKRVEKAVNIEQDKTTQLTNHLFQFFGIECAVGDRFPDDLMRLKQLLCSRAALVDVVVVEGQLKERYASYEECLLNWASKHTKCKARKDILFAAFEELSLINGLVVQPFLKPDILKEKLPEKKDFRYFLVQATLLKIFKTNLDIPPPDPIRRRLRDIFLQDEKARLAVLASTAYLKGACELQKKKKVTTSLRENPTVMNLEANLLPSDHPLRPFLTNCRLLMQWRMVDEKASRDNLSALLGDLECANSASRDLFQESCEKKFKGISLIFGQVNSGAKTGSRLDYAMETLSYVDSLLPFRRLFVERMNGERHFMTCEDRVVLHNQGQLFWKRGTAWIYLQGEEKKPLQRTSLPIPKGSFLVRDGFQLNLTQGDRLVYQDEQKIQPGNKLHFLQYFLHISTAAPLVHFLTKFSEHKTKPLTEKVLLNVLRNLTERVRGTLDLEVILAYINQILEMRFPTPPSGEVAVCLARISQRDSFEDDLQEFFELVPPEQPYEDPSEFLKALEIFCTHPNRRDIIQVSKEIVRFINGVEGIRPLTLTPQDWVRVFTFPQMESYKREKSEDEKQLWAVANLHLRHGLTAAECVLLKFELVRVASEGIPRGQHRLLSFPDEHLAFIDRLSQFTRTVIPGHVVFGVLYYHSLRVESNDILDQAAAIRNKVWSSSPSLMTLAQLPNDLNELIEFDFLRAVLPETCPHNRGRPVQLFYRYIRLLMELIHWSILAPTSGTLPASWLPRYLPFAPKVKGREIMEHYLHMTLDTPNCRGFIPSWEKVATTESTYWHFSLCVQMCQVVPLSRQVEATLAIPLEVLDSDLAMANPVGADPFETFSDDAGTVERWRSILALEKGKRFHFHHLFQAMMNTIGLERHLVQGKAAAIPDQFDSEESEFQAYLKLYPIFGLMWNVYTPPANAKKDSIGLQLFRFVKSVKTQMRRVLIELAVPAVLIDRSKADPFTLAGEGNVFADDDHYSLLPPTHNGYKKPPFSDNWRENGPSLTRFVNRIAELPMREHEADVKLILGPQQDSLSPPDSQKKKKPRVPPLKIPQELKVVCSYKNVVIPNGFAKEVVLSCRLGEKSVVETVRYPSSIEKSFLVRELRTQCLRLKAKCYRRMTEERS